MDEGLLTQILTPVLSVVASLIGAYCLVYRERLRAKMEERKLTLDHDYEERRLQFQEEVDLREALWKIIENFRNDLENIRRTHAEDISMLKKQHNEEIRRLMHDRDGLRVLYRELERKYRALEAELDLERRKRTELEMLVKNQQ